MSFSVPMHLAVVLVHPTSSDHPQVSPRDEVFVADTLNWRVQKYVKK